MNYANQIEITLSPFTIESYDQVFDLWEQCEGVGLSLIARIEEEIAGTVLVSHDGRRGYIYHLAVSPNYRRQGIGRIMVDQSLKNLRAVGILKCHLLLFKHNDTGMISVSYNSHPYRIINKSYHPLFLASRVILPKGW